jgi:xylulokinase
MTQTGATYEPDPATQAIYDRLYHEVYKGLFPCVQQSLQRLTALTHGAAG